MSPMPFYNYYSVRQTSQVLDKFKLKPDLIAAVTEKTVSGMVSYPPSSVRSPEYCNNASRNTSFRFSFLTVSECILAILGLFVLIVIYYKI